MRHYETIYIMNPNLAEEANKEVIEKFSSMIQKHDGVVVKIDEWGSKRLAYQIKKNDYGYYVLADYCGGPEITTELERELKLDDRILKYQTVKLEDNADLEALLQKVQEAQAKPAPEEDRETAGQSTETGEPETSEPDKVETEAGEPETSEPDKVETEAGEEKASEGGK
jgi:small subunit ribosomal protein S6